MGREAVRLRVVLSVIAILVVDGFGDLSQPRTQKSTESHASSHDIVTHKKAEHERMTSNATTAKNIDVTASAHMSKKSSDSSTSAATHPAAEPHQVEGNESLLSERRETQMERLRERHKLRRQERQERLWRLGRLHRLRRRHRHRAALEAEEDEFRIGKEQNAKLMQKSAPSHSGKLLRRDIAAVADKDDPSKLLARQRQLAKEDMAAAAAKEEIAAAADKEDLFDARKKKTQASDDDDPDRQEAVLNFQSMDTESDEQAEQREALDEAEKGVRSGIQNGIDEAAKGKCEVSDKPMFVAGGEKDCAEWAKANCHTYAAESACPACCKWDVPPPMRIGGGKPLTMMWKEQKGACWVDHAGKPKRGSLPLEAWSEKDKTGRSHDCMSACEENAPECEGFIFKPAQDNGACKGPDCLGTCQYFGTVCDEGTEVFDQYGKYSCGQAACNYVAITGSKCTSCAVKDRQLFADVDKNADGDLNEDEFGDYLSSLGMDDHQINELMDTFDIDYLNIQHFADFLKDRAAADSVGATTTSAPPGMIVKGGVRKSKKHVVLPNAMDSVFNYAGIGPPVASSGPRGCRVKWTTSQNQSAELCLTFETQRDKFKLFFSECRSTFNQQWLLEKDGCLKLVGGYRCVKGNATEAWLESAARKTVFGNMMSLPSLHARERIGAKEFTDKCLEHASDSDYHQAFLSECRKGVDDQEWTLSCR